MQNTALSQTIRATLNPALRDFWLAPARNRVLYGGRASSKSWDAAGFAIFLAQQCKIRVLCARQFQNRIDESVYALLKLQIHRFGLGDLFDIQQNKIICKVTGSEFLFYGLWRSIDEIKSMEDIDILWIEEAHNLTEEQWKILEPTIRKQGSQIWIIFNPKLSTDFVYKRFVVNPPPDTVKRLINYTENPFLSSTMLKVIEAAKEEDFDEFQHVYLGVPKENDEDSIIKRSWLMAAVDAHKSIGFEPSGRKRLGFDVADSGADKCALIYHHGSVALWADQWKAGEDELLRSCTRTYRAAMERDAEVIYDCIGVGASAGAKFNELNAGDAAKGRRIHHHKFNAGAQVWKPESEYQRGIKNKDMFANLKAQTWWRVADKMRDTYNAVRRGETFDANDLVSLASDLPYLDALIDELSTPKRDYDNAGRVKVESKKDLAKREIPSPNLADAYVMCHMPYTEPMRINPALLGRA